MIVSRKSEAGVSRPKQKPTKQFGMMQFVLVGAGIIVIIVVALLLFGGGAKKAAAPRTRMASTDEGGKSGRARRSSARKTNSRASKRKQEKARLREERKQRRQEARASGGRTTRSSSGGYTRGGSVRTASTPNQLRAILTDNTGSRTALVGERRLKAGDDVGGRRIVEVSADGVKVEYRQKTYTVRVGEKIY